MSTTIKMSDGDLFVDRVTGRARRIDGVEKCVQDVAATLMTSLRQVNRSGQAFPRAYGSELATLATPVQYAGLVGRPLVARKVQEAITRLIDMQEQDGSLTAAEHIVAIRRLDVYQFGTTAFTYFVELTVADGRATETVSNLQTIALNHQFPMATGTGTNERPVPSVP